MTTPTTASLTIDGYLETWDAVIRVHAVVDADVPTTFAATEQLDLLTIHSPLLKASFFVRDLHDA